jgi:retron-type reverse transcriptase
VARQRCWRYEWVLDLDIQSFFDQIDSNLLMRAVRKHTDCPWVLLYIERWLKAPVQMVDGSLVARERGTPQGGVISPILSNPSALHVRHLDAAEPSDHPVRALCR